VRTVTVSDASWTVAVLVAYIARAVVLAVVSGTEVDEGGWSRSEGQIRSMKVRCRSVWLLRFCCCTADPSGLWQLDKSIV
jgi:hypothetical protein